MCPFTTHDEAETYRIPMDLPAGVATRRSWVMVDKLTAIKRERVGAKITSATERRVGSGYSAGLSFEAAGVAQMDFHPAGHIRQSGWLTA